MSYKLSSAGGQLRRSGERCSRSHHRWRRSANCRRVFSRTAQIESRWGFQRPQHGVFTGAQTV